MSHILRCFAHFLQSAKITSTHFLRVQLIDIFSDFVEDPPVLWPYRIHTLLMHRPSPHPPAQVYSPGLVQNDSFQDLKLTKSILWLQPFYTPLPTHIDFPASVKPLPTSPVQQLFSKFTCLSIQILWWSISTIFMLLQTISYPHRNLQFNIEVWLN